MIDLVMITSGTGGLADKNHLPLGLLYVGSALKKAGFEITIHHCLPTEIPGVVSQIVAKKPLFVGLSVLTGSTTYYAAEMSKMIKREDPTIPIVWGGHHPTFTARQCLAQEYVDIVCQGEGEETAVELAQALDRKKPLHDVLSLGFKDKGKIVINDVRPLISNLDALDLNWSLLQLESYKTGHCPKDNRIDFFSSRGCPFSCGFCATPKFCGRKWRSHSVEYVVNHLTDLKKNYGFGVVSFADDNFLVDKERGFSILEELNKRGFNFGELDVRIDMIDEETLSRFVEYGATNIFIGWESGSDRLLKLIDKKITVAEIYKKVRMLATHPNLLVWASGILGLPTETREEMMKTINMAMELHRIIPGGVVSLFQYMPLPGTKLLPMAVEGGFKLPSKPEEWQVVDSQTNFYKISWLSWLTDKDTQNIRTTQDLTRKYMQKWPMSNRRTNVVRMIRRPFIYILRKRVSKQNFHFMADLWLFKLLMKVVETVSKVGRYGRYILKPKESN